MIEDIMKKEKVVNEIIIQLGEARRTENREKFKELLDKGYTASLEQSLAIAKEIDITNGILSKENIPKDYKEYLEIKKDLLNKYYQYSAMEMRLITIAGQKYGLTKAPTE